MKSGKSNWLSRTWARFTQRRTQPSDISGRRKFFLEALEDRRLMTLSPTDHIHPQITILLSGAQQTIPANIGVTTNKVYNPHTHDTSGILHIGEEGLPAGLGTQIRLVTMKDFFDVWHDVGPNGVANTNAKFDSTHLMDKTADATHVVHMYVNGQVNTQFETYVPQDDDQIVLAYEDATSTISFNTIGNQAVLGGSPLWLPLNATTANGSPLTYTVTVSNQSSPNLLQALIPNGNRSAKFSVQGFGDMTFELFDNLVPDVTDRFATLAIGPRSDLPDVGLSAPFYDKSATNTVTFHRVINNFVIQGGDPTNTGSGGSPLGDFDDEFSVDLQHNRTGLLSMAKSLDDTNDSQFFITEGAQRHLDSQHSIFGLLTTGESVRDAISNVATTSSRPNTPVVINSVSIFHDLQNRILELKAANGASGSADVTVTVSDANGHSANQTFHVTVTPDTNNNAPFLQTFATPRIATSGGTFQIPAIDPEGDAIYYEATKVGSVNYTVGVDHATGVVTVTPPAGFTGTLQVQIGVKDPNTAVVPGVGETQAQAQNRVFDLQTIDVVVSSAGPTGVDLLAAFDTGSSSTDNITNAGSLQFQVSGVNSGDLVRLFADGTNIGSATATGSTVTITTSLLASLPEGAHQITATRTVASVESAASPPLTVTYDVTPPPAFTSTAPTTAKTTQVLTYDAQNPEEGNAGFSYSLNGAPAGVAINTTTGVLTWTPAANQTGLAQFSIVAQDAAGNVRNQALSINVTPFVDPVVEVQLSIVNAAGTVLTQVPVGTEFFLVVKAKELVDDARAVAALYNDITFDANLAQRNGATVFPSDYPDQHNEGGSAPGVFDEIGGMSFAFVIAGASNGPPVQADFKEVYRVPMKALRGGSLTFSADPADQSGNAVIAFSQFATGNGKVASDAILFDSASVQVQASFTAGNDTITSVSEDTSNNTLNVLTNDLPGGTALTIVAVGTPNHGGAVTIASDGKTLLYTPAHDFDQVETFTYTAQNSSGEQAIATVTVNIQQVNDQPVATNDSLTAIEGQTALLDVLANDTTGPDTGETLTILSVGTSANGATLSLASGNTRISYRSAPNFSGTDTFTYTISDGHGGTATATASVVVSPVNDPPLANVDTPTVIEDSTNNTLNVLANDSDPENAALTITAVGAGDKGGTLTIASDKKSLIYTPAGNFQGVESFTYSISDGVNSATSQVHVTVSNTNDPPTAGNDAVTTYRDSSGLLIDVLANDSSAPDPAESLQVSSASQPGHGTTTVVGNKVQYVPAAGFVGTDTFTYVVSDGSLNSTATVVVTVAQYQPTFVSGQVFFDANGNGVRDLNESPLGGVTLSLTGSDLIGGTVTRDVTTDATGAYRIEGVLPGSYSLSQGPVPLSTGGAAIVGSQGGTVQSADRISFTISPDVAASGLTNYVFTERPAVSNLGVSTGKASLFAKRVTSALAMAVAPGASAAWVTPSGIGWSGLAEVKASLDKDATAVTVTTKDSAGISHQATVLLTDPRVRLLGQQNGMQLLQLRGTPAAFGLGNDTNSGSNSTVVSGVNQAPINSLPLAQSVQAGGTLTFSGAKAISVSDADAGNALLQVSLAANHGKVALPAAAVGAIAFTSGSTNNAASMTFTGTQSSINAALNGATFTPDSGFTGGASLTINTSDLGHTGTGGALVDIDTLAISVTNSSGEGESDNFASAADQFFGTLA